MYCHNCGVACEGMYCAACLSPVPCSVCNKVLDPDSFMSVLGEHYCRDCFNARFTYCNICGRVIGRGNNPYGDECFCDRCFSREFLNCHYCGETTRRMESYSTPNDDRCCGDCFSEHCGVCDGCGGTFYSSELDRGRCCDCEENRGEWESSEFIALDTEYTEVGSRRRYGVELETSDCSGYRELRGNTIWECKHDCSIEGMEFVSPILYGDAGLAEIKNFCAFARQKHWHVNRHCGYHAHFDISDESWDSLRSVAYAYRKTYQMWSRLVPASRAENSYCGSPDYDLSTLREVKNAADWDYFVGARDRFEFVNWRAYLVHGSLEVRTHAATLDGNDVCNWIKLHARFIDNVSAASIEDIDKMFQGGAENQFATLSNLVGEELSDIYAQLSHEQGHSLRRRASVLTPPF